MGDSLKPEQIPTPQIDHSLDTPQSRDRSVNQLGAVANFMPSKLAHFPRIPGIEAVGTVEAAPGGEFAAGAQVATMMGGMGREFDGGYAEYVRVPAGQVIGFTSDLPWATLGAVPEMLQTAAGSPDVGVRATRGESLLIRGGTSSVGMALAVLAKLRGLRVLATTRNPDKAGRLRRLGVDHVIIDDGEIAPQVRDLVPGGVDGAVELVGVNVPASSPAVRGRTSADDAPR